MSESELVASGSLQVRRLSESLPARLESNVSAAAATSLPDRVRGLAYRPVHAARTSRPRHDNGSS